MKFSEIARQLSEAAGGALACDRGSDPDIAGVAAIDAAVPGTLSYIEGDAFADRVATTAASALVLPAQTALQQQASDRGLAWVASKQPRLTFAQAIALFYRPFQPAPHCHPSASIDPSATLGQDVAVGAGAVIQAGATLGEGVRVHPGAVVYPQAEVGERSVLHANCVVEERACIGPDCVIHSGATIGGEGFGFVQTAQGWYKMPQSGRTVLEAGVEVGCNSNIDRPAVGETRVGRNTKIDNAVQIGHGCRIGEACALASQVGLAGGVTIGNRVLLGGQVGVANQAHVGDGAVATAKAGVTSNVGAGQVVSGYPLLPHSLFLRVSAIYRRLPELYQSIKTLKQRLPG